MEVEVGAVSEERWMKKGQGVAVWGKVNLLAVHNILNTFLTFTPCFRVSEVYGIWESS